MRWTRASKGEQVVQVVVDPHAGRIYAETESGLYRADLLNGVPAGDRRRIEYYHQGFDHCFVTAETDEIAKLDDDRAGACRN